MKPKITTSDEKIYNALNRLRHESEVVMERPIDQRALNRILSHNDNIVAISHGGNVVLKRLKDYNFDLYLKRIWGK